MTPDQIQKTLRQYHADFEPVGGDILDKNGRKTGVYISFKNKRMRIATVTIDDVLMTGPIAASTIEAFVEKFWFWKKG